MNRYRDIVVVGASAGGVQALRHLVGALPADFPASVLVVQHLSPDYPSKLPEILSWDSNLPVAHARDREPLERRRVYVAPPDHHLLVDDVRAVRVVRGPKENRARPALDVLFRSAASAYGPRVIGVVLTGHLDDGTAGLHAVKKRGGVAIVQDPGEAEAPSMPASALRAVEVDYVLPLAEIGPRLARLVGEPVEAPELEAPNAMKIEVQAAREGMTHTNEVARLGAPSAYACPECHGVLFEIVEGAFRRYRCRTGHAYSSLALMAEMASAVEAALWMGLRALEETEGFARELAETERTVGKIEHADELLARADRASEHIDALRQIILAYEKPTPG